MKQKKRISRVIKPRSRQIGISNTKLDLKRRALNSGKRISRNNKVYYENRKNRSDKTGLNLKEFKALKLRTK